VTKFQPGQDCLIDFDGVEVTAEVIRQSNGWVMAIAAIDSDQDWGSIGPRLDPHSTICVPENRVRTAETTTE